MRRSMWTRFAIGLLLLGAAGCAAPSPTVQPSTPTGSATPAPSAASVQGGGAIGQAAPSPTPSPTPTPTPSPTPSPTPTPTPTATPTPTPSPTPSPTPGAGGPFVVKQVITLGGETISGVVCSLTAPFVVHAVAPAAAWDFAFAPQTADGGTVAYAYSIPKAGESHDARGKYTVGRAGPDGVRLLQMKVSDHVVFKGFDGNIPVNYSFNLAPIANPGCPAAP